MRRLRAEHATRDEPAEPSFANLVAEALLKGPDIVLAYGFHPTVHAALLHARANGAHTVHTVRAWGYDDPSWYSGGARRGSATDIWAIPSTSDRSHPC